MALSSSRSTPLVQLPLGYLDWNIFDGFSKGLFPELRKSLVDARDEGLIHLPYTEWHLFEAVNVSAEVENHQYLVERNLDIIKEITDLVCIWEGNSELGWNIIRNPLDSTFDVSTTQKLVATSELLKPILAAFTVIKKQLLSFGLTPGTLNKFEPTEVIQEINQILIKPENLETYSWFSPTGITFEELIDMSIKMMPETTTDLQRLSSIYFLIDQIGYYSDKSVEKRILSLWRDGMHVAWASRSQFLISNDERLRKKAQLVYLLFGIQTPVFDPAEALPIVEWMLSNASQLKEEFERARG